MACVKKFSKSTDFGGCEILQLIFLAGCRRIYGVISMLAKLDNFTSVFKGTYKLEELQFNM